MNFCLKSAVGLSLFLLGLVSCGKFTRNIDLHLPEVPRELVIECYLEAGRPYRVLLTETKGYFDSLDECPFVKNARVVIEHQGIRDTLDEAPFIGDCSLTHPNLIPFFNEERTRFYNYGSSQICPLDYNNDFRIEVYDSVGNRFASASTRMLAPVYIQILRSEFETGGEHKALVQMIAQDDAATQDYYRVTFHKRHLYVPDSASGGLFNVAIDPNVNSNMSDYRYFNGKEIERHTRYIYQENDTVIITLYHTEAAYYGYLRTLGASGNANGSPFAQPPSIKTNIIGGKGIFTFLSYDRDTIVVQP